MDLDKIRIEINKCDEAIQENLAKRFLLVEEVAKYKRENKISIFDQRRERKIIETIANKDINNAVEISEVYNEILKISRKFQSNILLNSNIFLVGFMGSGKTTVGNTLAEITGLKFIDLDEIIEKEEDMKIKDIFSNKGEKKFREMETETLKIATKEKKAIISCGGGIILKEENRKIINNAGITIFLNGDIKEMMSRVGNDENRPVLKNLFRKNKEEEYDAFQEILNARMKYYKEVEDIEIIIDNKTPHDISNEIIVKVLEKQSY